MNISEHMQLIEDMVNENPDALGIMLPADSVKFLLKAYRDLETVEGKLIDERNDRKSLKRAYNKERKRADEFTIKYYSMEANYDRLKELM